jgi:hypothetical protein
MDQAAESVPAQNAYTGHFGRRIRTSGLPAGRFPRVWQVWQVPCSNQRRLSRRFYKPHSSYPS